MNVDLRNRHSTHPEDKKVQVPIVKFTPALQQLQNNQKQNGIYFKTHHQIEAALKCFGAAHDILKSDYMPIFNSSLCHFELADIDKAQEEVIEAIQLCPKHHELALRHHLIDCVYNQNYFEEALLDANTTLRENVGHFNSVECNGRIFALRSTIDFSIGEHAGPCLLNLRGAIADLEKLSKIGAKSTKRVCGVSSEPDVVRKKLKPLLMERIKSNRRMINNEYLIEIAQDYTFLLELQKDPRLKLKQTEYTNGRIGSLLNPTVDRVTGFRNMLHHRQPIYSKKFNMIANAKKAAEYRTNIMNRIQIQTRRDIFQQLQKIRKLAKDCQVSKLVNYTISILQHYYSIKTNRIFPRISEFRNELCNIVSISFLNQIKIPQDLMLHQPFDRFSYLIAAKKQDKAQDTTFQQPTTEFGDRAAFTRLHSVDTSYISYKHRVQMLEQLIELVETPIEKCFISYEVSRMHLYQIKIDEARSMARKVVENSELCGNDVWLYLGHLQHARCDANQQNLGHIQLKLQEMKRLCYNLNGYIEHFTNVAIKLNQIDIDTKDREEREKREETEHEEALRQERRDMFLRMSIARESQPGITPTDVRRHSTLARLSTVSKQA